jgi:hypothetical protein
VPLELAASREELEADKPKPKANRDAFGLEGVETETVDGFRECARAVEGEGGEVGEVGREMDMDMVLSRALLRPCKIKEGTSPLNDRRLGMADTPSGSTAAAEASAE